MTEIQIFNNTDFGEIRTLEENGQILFCGSDVAKALGYTNPQKALRDHCKEDGVTFRSVIDRWALLGKMSFAVSIVSLIVSLIAITLFLS